MPPPLPPIVKPGRMTAGRPISSSALRASSIEYARRERAHASPIFSIASRNSRRPSAFWIDAGRAPIISTSNFSSTPMSCSCIAQLSAVWPPSVGRIASGRSLSMILATTSGVIGSM